jgi:serine/threonine-protein kinase
MQSGEVVKMSSPCWSLSAIQIRRPTVGRRSLLPRFTPAPKASIFRADYLNWMAFARVNIRDSMPLGPAANRLITPTVQGVLPIAPGTKLGPWEVQESIGEGSMGVVYRAYHAELERTGAVKVLQAIGPDPDTKSRFRREALAIAHMRHPNILNVFDFGEYRGTPYMIVEYVPGGSLADRLESRPIDRETAVAYLRGIGEALDYAHSLGIVHRDVKPGNVLLAPDETPILADFGLVKLMESSVKSMTGVTTGTPAYMAPEQVTGTDVGPAADRYSLATIAFELLTGGYPFEGEGVMEMLYAHVHRQPPPPSSHQPDLGPEVDAVVLRGLAKTPSERWPTCEAFVDALAAALSVGTSRSGVVKTIPLNHLKQVPVRVLPPIVVDPEPEADLPLGQPVEVERIVAVDPDGEVEDKPRRPWYRDGALALIPLLLIAGYCGYNAVTQPALTVAPVTAHRGDQVVVTATNVPANQAGDIQLRGTSYSFPFRSDSGGNVRETLVIPADTPLGDVGVRICWSSSCHAESTLRVIGAAAPVATSATPSAGPSASPSPSASATPPAGAAPTGAPAPVASSAPQPQPQPQPSVAPTSPPPAPSASISLSSKSIVIITGSVTVYGQHFGAGKAITITFAQGAFTKQFSATAGADGSFSKLISPQAVTPGQATITACDANSCASQYITVTAT